MDWIKRNEAYLGDIARDEYLSDAAYVDVLEDLVDRAESAIDAKKSEMSDDDEVDEGDSEEEDNAS
jgi:hypothetical protein